MKELSPISPEIFLGVGLLAFAINFLATYEVQQIQNKDALRAATAASASCVLGSLLLYAFVENPLYGVSEVAGTFAGTYLQVRRGARINVTK